MNNAGERSKALVVRLGILANKLTYYRYGIPKTVVTELVDLQKEMNADKELRENAQFYFEVLADLVSYTDAMNTGQKAIAAGYMAQSIAKWNEIDAAINALCDMEGGNASD